ncbi:MAG: 2-dehydropantoate 2-reductase [Chloroflexi bacterium]|nr:2-dehydropantoate 2-reductase [Chloroflexota bacterium]
MRIVVLGAGALGSIIAGHLARAGEDVVVVARGDRAGYLRQHGITITGLADFNSACPVITDPLELRGADVLIMAVKTYDTAAALAPLRHLDVATVLSVQNGVLKNEQLADAFGPGKTVGAAAFFSGEVLTEGSARFTLNQGFYVGELPEGTSERVQQLVGALARAGVQAEATAHIQSIEWSKFVVWVGGTVLSLLTRLETHKFLSDPDAALICTRLMRETAALATTRGIALEDMPSFPVKTVTSVTEAEGVEKSREVGAIMQARAPMHRYSSLQDLEHGRRLEVEETLGYVVAKAATAGLAVPTVDTCYRLILGINRFVR